MPLMWHFRRLFLLVAIILIQNAVCVPIEVTLQHGDKLGASYEEDTGIVNSVKSGSKAEIQGVRIDMKIARVNGSPFSHELLKQKCTSGMDPCTLTLLPKADYTPASGIYRKIAGDMYNKMKGDMSVGVSWASRLLGSQVGENNETTNDPDSMVSGEDSKEHVNLESENVQETTMSDSKTIGTEGVQETTRPWWDVIPNVTEVQKTSWSLWQGVSNVWQNNRSRESNETTSDTQDTSVKGKLESIWNAATRLFTPDDVFVEIENATKPEKLGTILKKFADDPKVVQAITDLMLGDKFGAKCQLRNEVAQHSWAAQTSMQTKEIAAPYLRYCHEHWSPDMRKLVLEASVDLLEQSLDTSTTVQVLPQVVREALQFLKDSLESDASKETTAVETALARSPYKVLVQMLPAAQDELPCEVLRALVRRAKPNSTIMNSETTSTWDLAELRKIHRKGKKQQKVKMDACLSTLMSDLRNVLTLSSSPSNIIRPEEKTQSGSPDLLPGEALDDALRRKIIGQDCVIAQLADDPGYVSQRMDESWNSQKPLVLLFLGPSGVGKTAISKHIAEAIHGKPSAQLEREGLLTVIGMDKFSKEEDKWSLFGPPEGMQGKGKLGEALEKRNAVVVLDEIEKAHPDFAKNFLSAFGEGGYADQQGKVSSKHATFILTSNLAKDLIHKRVEEDPSLLRIPPERCSTTFRTFRDEHITPYLKRHRLDDNSVNWFKDSEMRGRLTDVLPFLPFALPVVENAVNLFLSEMSSGAAMPGNFKNVSLVWEQDVVEFLSRSYELKPEEGLRAVRDQVEIKVRQIMKQALEVELLREHCEIVLRVVKGQSLDSQKLDLRIVANRDKHVSLPPSSTTIAPRITDSPPGGKTPWSWFSSPGGVETQTPTTPSSDGRLSFQKDFDWKWTWSARWIWFKEFVWEHRYAFGLSVIAIVLTVVAPYAAPAIGGAGLVNSVASAGVAAAVLPVSAVVGTTGLAVAACWYLVSPWFPCTLSCVIAIFLFFWSRSFRNAFFALLYKLFQMFTSVAWNLVWNLLRYVVKMFTKSFDFTTSEMAKELQALPLSQLQKRAIPMGVSQKEIDSALDETDPKKALIRLILSKKADCRVADAANACEESHKETEAKNQGTNEAEAKKRPRRNSKDVIEEES